MSKRKRHSHKQKDTGTREIEWLKHRTGYPTPEEREQIIQLRQELSVELIKTMLTGGKPDGAEVKALTRKYGSEEVQRVINTFSETMEMPAFIADDAKSYRDYRHRYSRFGAGLKFYSAKEMDELFKSYKDAIMGDNDANPFEEYEKNLLFGWREWEDITPPAVPPRPGDFNTPQPGTYPMPINELLEWGDHLYQAHDFSDNADIQHWRKFIPALTRMALDPGLLHGWAADKPSWAPWHAIHVLGELQAWESAPALANLADIENDWLSDHLPHIWAEMGFEVEPSLWMIAEDNSASAKKRGLAIQSLYMMTEENEAMDEKVIKGYKKILTNTKSFDTRVNAYVIHFLNEMETVDDVWDVIEQAFDEERVDLDVITMDDLLDDDYDDDGWDDEFEDDFDEDDDEGRD